MPITPKPFNAADNLIKTVFRGAPNIFADVDLNRQIDLQNNLDDHFLANVGGRWRSTAANPLNLTAEYSALGALTWFYSFTDAVYQHRGSELKFSGTTGGTLVGPNATVRFYLMGRRELLTFGTNPVLCGIQTDVFPNPVAGADVVRWADCGLYAASGVTLPAVPPGYELLACVALIAPDTKLSANGFDVIVAAQVFYDSSARGVVTQFVAERPDEQAPLPSLWQAMSALTRYARRAGYETRALVNRLAQTLTTRLDAALLDLGNLVARQTHDRAFYDKFMSLTQTPLVLPAGGQQSPDNVLATHLVPPGPPRNYLVHFTLAFQRITSVAELDIVVYRGSSLSSGLVPEGRLYAFTCLGGDGASMIATVSSAILDVSAGERIVCSVENRNGNTNQVRVTRASMTVDGLPV